MKIDKEKGLARRSLGEGGQALLIVVLIMVVALTVGLSLAGRSIVNIRTSTEEADSQKALVAAEAGIEQALQINNSTSINATLSENNSSYVTTIKEVKGNNPFLTNGGNIVSQDDGVDIWLVDHDADGKPNLSSFWTGTTLNIYWGDQSLTDCNNAAIEVSLISKNPNPPPDFTLKRNAFDPCGKRKTNNKFNDTVSSGAFSVEGKQLHYKATISGISSGLVARAVPIYASTEIAVDGNGIDLPTQGYSIASTGTSGAGDRQVAKSIDYFRAYTQLAAPYFTYGLFSP